MRGRDEVMRQWSMLKIPYIDPKAAARFLEYVDAMVDLPEARIGAEHAALRGL